MKQLEQETTAGTAAASAPGSERYPMSYPELCSEFLGSLARAAKNTALYTLSHPMVIESLRRSCALLGALFDAKKEATLTLAFLNDSWLFNDSAVPAVTQESQNLSAFFKAHSLHGLTFSDGVQPFEMGALCEFLSAQAKSRPEGYIEEFFAGKGVGNIRPESVRYVKEGGYSAQPQSYGGAPAAAPKPAQAQPGAGQAAPQPVPRQQPGPDRRPAVPLPIPGRKAPQPGPQAAQTARPALKANPDLDSMFGPPPRTQTPGGKPGEGEVRKKTGPGGVSGQAAGPGSGAGGGAGGGPEAEGPGGGAPGESALARMSFGGILKGLVETAAKNPADRVRAYEEAMKILQNAMEQQVAESTRALAAEKEQALNTRARTERVLSKAADGKVIIDKDGKILMMNPAAEEIAGTRFADAVGRHISEQMKPGEHFLTLSKDMDLSGGKIVSGEVEEAGDEHMGRTLRRSVAMLVDSDGRVVGELRTLPEITKYKETQRMQEEFLSRITHDLQSPLSSITSALEMLNEAAMKKLDPMENKFLDISIRNSHRLSQMIRGILDFSKLQSGKMDVHPEPVPLAPMLAEAVEGLTPWAKTKGITLACRDVPPDLYAQADAPRIVQVLTNLISNAIKATPAGGAVTVAAAQNPEKDGSVLVGVKDTGAGIPKEDLEKIFEKFVQLSSRPSMEGVGLGLAIVSDFIKLHNGRVWASSEMGKGSTFYFTLPHAEKPADGL